MHIEFISKIPKGIAMMGGVLFIVHTNLRECKKGYYLRHYHM